MADSEFSVTSRVGPVLAGVHAALAQLVARKAEEVAAHAGQGAPVETSSLAQSYYYSTSEGSGYEGATARAAAVNPHAEIAPEAAPPASDLEGVTASAVAHALFVELGTVKMAAQHHFLPAMEQARAELPAEIAAAVRTGAEL